MPEIRFRDLLIGVAVAGAIILSYLFAYVLGVHSQWEENQRRVVALPPLKEGVVLSPKAVVLRKLALGMEVPIEELRLLPKPSDYSAAATELDSKIGLKVPDHEEFTKRMMVRAIGSNK